MPGPDPFMTDDENPERSDAQLAALRPAVEVLGEAFMQAQAAAKARRANKPAKVRVTLWLDSDVIEHFKSEGQDWRKRIGDVLAVAARTS